VSGAPLTVVIRGIVGRTGRLEARRCEFAFRRTGPQTSGQRPVFGLGEGGPQGSTAATPVHHGGNGQFQCPVATVGRGSHAGPLADRFGWVGGVLSSTVRSDRSHGSRGAFRRPRTWRAPPLDLFFIASQEPAEILREYAQLTGFPHMPPLWSLGYQQSHRTLASRDEIMGEPAGIPGEETLPATR